jgi:hypothetical protein
MIGVKLIDDVLDEKQLKLEAKHNACFVAGTLVHTDKGLVPIEQLKVGDMVLSKPESGEGEVAYKRVLKTFKSPEKHRIMRIAYRKLLGIEPENVREFLPHAKEKDWSDDLYIYCTVNHPFWTKEKGWVTAENLISDDHTLDIDYTLLDYRGSELFAVSQISHSTPLVKTLIPDVAIQQDWSSSNSEPSEIYNVIDFRSGSPVILTNFPKIEGLTGLLCDNSWDKNQPYVDFDKNPDHPSLKDFMSTRRFYSGSNVYCIEKGYFSPSDSYEDAELNFRSAMLVPQNRSDMDSHKESDDYYYTTVYNIEVEDYHTYFVGEDGVWVHNTNNCLSEEDFFRKLEGGEDIFNDAVISQSQSNYQRRTNIPLDLLRKYKTC